VNDPGPSPSFWRRRILDPILRQLKQGTSPEKIALTIAAGVAGGLFPFLGFTTLLCLLIAGCFRLNQPIIHVINQVLWPVHLTMIPVYVRLGERLYGADALPFHPQEVTEIFLRSQSEFWASFGLMGLHALTAWLITVPFIVAILFYSLRPVLHRLRANVPAAPTL